MVRSQIRSRVNGFPSVPKQSGLDFVHVNGASGRFFYPEILAPGVGLLDYDNDGDLDVYLVQGRTLGRARRSTRVPPQRRSRAVSTETT